MGANASAHALNFTEKVIAQMADNKKLVSEITSMDVDFAQWYTDIVKKAEMIDYSSVKGCVIMRPYAQALWENIQKTLDGMFKETGHENVAMPDRKSVV